MSARNGIHLGNWRIPPYNRWAFGHVRELVPSAAIAAEPGLSVLPRELGFGAGFMFEGADGKSRSLDGFLAESYTDGFMVMQYGHVLTEWYADGRSPRTPHLIFSVSKSVTALIAGVLAGKGLLHPEAPVTDYLPDAKGSAYGDATVRHVLDMTVSIEFDESYLDPKGAFALYRQATGWNPPADPANPLDLRSFLTSLPRAKGPHGEIFHYVSPNSDLLGLIVEAAGKAPFAELLSDYIWKPMGASADGYITVDRLGAPRAAGGICITLEDMARLGELMRCRGLANGRQIVPGSWIDDILTQGSRDAWLKGDLVHMLPNGRYRSKWYQTGDEHGGFCAVGIHGQWIWCDPVTGVVIAKQSSQALPVDDAMDQLNLSAFAAISRELA